MRASADLADRVGIITQLSPWQRVAKGASRMDALKRPLRIPMEFSRYAEEKGIFELYELMLKEILVHKPEDPLKFLHEFLGRKNHDGKLAS